MSTPQPSTSTPVEKDKSKRRSFQRFVSKIIKTTKSKKATETAETPGESSTSATAPATTTPALVEVPETSTSAPAEAEAKPAETAPEAAPTKPAAISVGARALAEKHGIEIPEDWPYAPRPPVGERVEKPIRMRVRRYCHVCQTAFGSEKTCSNCDHKRCVECPRTPPKSEKKKHKPKHKEYDPYEGIVMPAKHEKQDRVYRKIRQRVHYKCHKCEADFAGQKVCGNCSHTRCKKCHREPSRKPKPVEEPRRKKPIKWTCSECQTSANITKHCTNCNHSRCVDCVREVSKKKKPVLVSDAPSDTDTKDEGGQSLIDKVSSALAATSLTS